MIHVDLCITPREDDIEYIRNERKFWSHRIQRPDLTKVDRKEAQRYVKNCTIFLEHFTGTKGGKPEGMLLNKAVLLPIELKQDIEYLVMHTTSDHKPYKDLMK